MKLFHHDALRLHRLLLSRTSVLQLRYAAFSNGPSFAADPRRKAVGRLIKDEYAALHDHYSAPKNPVILAHGLFGFDELHLVGNALPGIQYWRGIIKALEVRGVEVITAAVPASGSLEVRARELAKCIERKAKGKSVNIIAHSMGGLDSRWMISRLHPPNVNVLSLTTISTPHRGSALADYMLQRLEPRLTRIYKAMTYFGLETDAFSQLTRKYMNEEFNPNTPDLENVRYYSYGAQFKPSLWSVFRLSHAIIQRLEGANDGLVSVESSQWGSYKGTLVDVSHLDLINWSNRVKWFLWELFGMKKRFNAVAFYLDIADMLAKEGL